MSVSHENIQYASAERVLVHASMPRWDADGMGKAFDSLRSLIEEEQGIRLPSLCTDE